MNNVLVRLVPLLRHIAKAHVHDCDFVYKQCNIISDHLMEIPGEFF